MARWRADPALGRSAVEELLRFVVPAETATERYATRDTEVAGVGIPRGELVAAVLASANWNATQFANPDRLDPGGRPTGISPSDRACIPVLARH